jgi:hypothetical protein
VGSEQKIRSIVDEFVQSGMTRREFCERHKIPITTLDYWRRIRQRQPQLVEVTVEALSATGFALVVANGRRIESSWQFADAELVRLIRIVESA